MRIILYTGKGGVGKTTISAATALKCAARGYRTLVVSTDPAHSLSDSFDVRLQEEPVRITKNLHGQEINGQAEIEKHFSSIKQFISEFLASHGLDEVASEELAVLPGMDELFSLLRIKEYAEQEAFEVCIVDCAPTGATLRLLSLPDVLRWYLKHIFPIQRTAMGLARPVARRWLRTPLPGDEVFKNLERFYTQVIGMREILNQPAATIRLVLNAEKMAIKETQRAATHFGLFGLKVDLIVVNKVFPENLQDRFFDEWKRIQKNYSQFILESFAPVPVSFVSLFSSEITGIRSIEGVGDSLFADLDPAKVLFKGKPFEIKKEKDCYRLKLFMPFAEKGKIDLLQHGDDLTITAGSYRRNFMLPSALAGLNAQGAEFVSGALEITFRKAANHE